jgi:putative transposase
MRSGTFSKIYLQFIFSVRNRRSLIDPAWEDNLYKYITGIIRNKGQLLVAINGHWDHIHILTAIHPNCVISDLVREVKKSSSNYINDHRYTPGKFSWQDGYGAFSYSRLDINMVSNYIHNQKKHHQTVSFKSEYMKLLQDFEIEFDPKYLFTFLDFQPSTAVV